MSTRTTNKKWRFDAIYQRDREVGMVFCVFVGCWLELGGGGIKQYDENMRNYSEVGEKSA
jgi:hypothetical protein